MAKDILKLDVQEKPTIFNKDMVIGGYLGAYTLGIAGIVVGLLSGVSGLGAISFASGWAAGGYIGGSMGKSRTEYENENGKPVKKPGLLGFINKDLFATAMGIGLVGEFVTSALVLVGSPLAGVAALATIGGIGIGAVVGSVTGYMNKDKEYEKAKEQEMQRQLEQQRSRQPQHGLQQEHDLGQGKNHVKDLEAQRGKAQEYGMSVV